MKIRLLITSFILLALVGCATTGESVVTVKPEAVPLLICPPSPVILPPHLMIQDLTDADRQNPDKIAKAWKGSVIQLKAYADELQKVIDQYNQISQQYTDLRKQLLQKYPELQTTNPDLFK